MIPTKERYKTMKAVMAALLEAIKIIQELATPEQFKMALDRIQSHLKK